MRTLGIIFIVAGILSSALYFLHMNFLVLNWISHWGPDKAWLIRGGMILLGFILYFVGKPGDRA